MAHSLSRTRANSRPDPFWLFGFLALALAACSGSQLDSDGARTGDRSALATELARLVADAERAQANAESPDEALDHQTRARLLRQAAEAHSYLESHQTERRQLSTQLAELESEVQELRGHWDRSRQLAEQEAAAELARTQSSVAFERAVRDERRRRISQRERESLHREAAETLRNRAQLISASSQALGAEEDDLEQVRITLDQSRRARDASQQLALAERALRLAYRSLASVPVFEENSEDLRTAFFTALSEASIAGEQRDEGFFVHFDQVFRGRQVTPGERAARRLRRFAATCAGLIRGPIVIWVQATDRGSRQLASRRSAALARLFREEGVSDDRIRTLETDSSGHQASILLPSLRATGPTSPETSAP